ncbi:MAG: hypothetical protein DWQ01_08165 [Planctomycetota bacterium]|nr:MAG: hypothetical protein DWQ01_08165 [Planctomycetota bacterium]
MPSDPALAWKDFLEEKAKAIAFQRSREQIYGLIAVALFFALIPIYLVLPAYGWIFALLLLVLILRGRMQATRKLRRLRHGRAWGERALARLQDRYPVPKDDGVAFADPHHPCNEDLDVFGPDSLYARLQDCPTFLGRERLAAWLLQEGVPEDGQDRQACVRSLQADRAFREGLEIELREVEFAGSRDPFEARRLEQELRALPDWGKEASPPEESFGRKSLRLGLAMTATLLLAAKFIWAWSWWVLLPSYLLHFAWLARHQKRAAALDERFFQAGKTLAAWARVLQWIEQRPASSPLWQQARQRLLAKEGESLGAGDALQALGRVSSTLAFRRHAIWQLSFGVLWLWDLHAMLQVERWKRRHGPRLGAWLEVVGDLEAFAALAAYADGQPNPCWPEFLESDRPWFQAKALAHPLLPRESAVANDFEIASGSRLWLVTGSNRSGKSTFLRTIGLAIKMAALGLPVSAATLSLRPMAVISCMRVEDSLRLGLSRFHAEVQRLQRCVAYAGEQHPALVLLDEVLAGTNSKDRHRGTLAVLQRLLQGPAVCLAATHDEDLKVLAEERPQQVGLVHFRDFVEDGEMKFDFQLREGPLPRSNALWILSRAGLLPSEEGIRDESE